jgi:hypothetical protein
MRHAWLIGLALLATGCTWFREPEPARRITPGSRIIYNSTSGDTIWSVCDKGNILYLTEKSPQIVVVPGGCPSGQP